jgi:uncharacterized membrane protein required for colicin V production
MSWIDLAGVGLIGVFVGVGAMRGFVAGILGVLTLVAAWTLSYFGADPLSGAVAASLGTGPLISWLLAGSAIFALAWLVFWLASGIWLRRRRRERGAGITRTDRIGGALLGGAQGALVAVLLYWLVGQAQAGGLMGAQSQPSALVQASQHVVASGAQAVLGSEASPLAARMVADPVGTASQLQAVLETPAMTELQGDTLFWQYVSSGAIDQALNQASFMRAANDARLRQRIVDLGVMPEEARDDPKAFRSATRDALAEVAPRLQAIREDPAMAELAADPAVRQALEAGDVLSLATNPKIRELVSRALSAGPPASPAPAE